VVVEAVCTEESFTTDRSDLARCALSEPSLPVVCTPFYRARLKTRFGHFHEEKPAINFFSEKKLVAGFPSKNGPKRVLLLEQNLM
jgi:hypothetical protein